jgi:holliday junction DNA helicase RuvA
MIGLLNGKLISKKPPFLLVDVHGVGYEVQASMLTIFKLPDLNQSITLYIHMVSRETAQELYGFYDEKEKILFKELIKASGVGPKLALGILSGMDVNSFVNCVERKDIAQLTKLPGVGKKTAERIVVEMQNRLTKQLPLSSVVSTSLCNTANSQDTNIQDAISALISLGYKPSEANQAIRKLNQTASSSETLIKLALQELSRYE